MPFSLTSNPSLTEISDAINYLLNNFGSNVSIDIQTGIIAGPSGRISNLYKYISIKYATSYDGTVGFSNVPTNATYYGIRNSNDTTESSNPADYIWYKTTGFGTTNFLYYIVAGGRQIDFYLSPTPPNAYYVLDPGTAIDIDIVTTTSTINAAVPTIFIWTSGSAPSRPTTTSTYTWATGSYSAPTGWTTSPTTNSNPGYVQWQIRIPITANTNVTTSTLDWTNTSYAITQYSSNGTSGTSGYSGSSGFSGLSGTSANKYATAYLYQWSSSAPGNPSGTSTYTWATGASSSYTGANGWSVTVPTNPGTSGVSLWVASKQVSDVSTATSTTVSWTSGFSTYVAGQNGASVSGVQTARPTVYQWALSTPSISGTSTYTWSTGAYTAPTGWATSITASPSAGYTLYAATVPLTDSATATTTTINWTTASIVTAGYAGSNGASSRICYARVASNPTPTSGNITTTGSSSFPTSSQSTTTWGFAATWVGSDPNPSSTNSLYQSDGVYDPSTGNTVWSTPYISSLKVGALSAVSTNTGSLTVSGTLQANTASISGTTMTGSGGVLYSTGLFAFGDSSTNIAYNGSQLTLNGNVVQTSNINNNAVTSTAGSTLSSTTSYSLPVYPSSSIILSATINSGGSPVWATASVKCTFYVATGSDFYIALLDGSGAILDIYHTPYYLIDTDVNITLSGYASSTSTGNLTYRLRISSATTGTSVDVYQYTNIFVIATKR